MMNARQPPRIPCRSPERLNIGAMAGTIFVSAVAASVNPTMSCNGVRMKSEMSIEMVGIQSSGSYLLKFSSASLNTS